MNKYNEDLFRITTDINRGATLAQVCERFYDAFKSHVPYDRIGVSVICEEGTMVKAVWCKSDCQRAPLVLGYQAPLKGSTLQTIIDTGKPRIINNLEEYLREHPNSQSTKLVLQVGVKSSLTCPLLADGKEIGFLFFSKNEINAYKHLHIDIFMEIAEHLSLVVARTLNMERLKELNELKNKFLGIAAHDLRSPLALVQSYIDMLSDPDVQSNVEQREYIYKRLKFVTNRMFNLLNNLLDISAIESGKLNLELKEADLIPFLKEVVENHRLTAQAKNVTVVKELPETLPIVKIDKNRLAQVIDNLFTNAVKFSSKGTEVKLSAKVEGNFVKVSVIDHGQGIPEAEQAKVFQEFGKTSVRPTDGEKSTGLGLAIVKKIIVGHGGVVTVKSKVGQGSTFSFTLPIVDA